MRFGVLPFLYCIALFATTLPEVAFVLRTEPAWNALESWPHRLDWLVEISTPLIVPTLGLLCWLAFFWCCRMSGKRKILSLLPIAWIVCSIVWHFDSFPRSNWGSSSSGQYDAREKLEQISQAIRNYQQEKGHLPPAYTTDANSNPMHSWRVLILPYFEPEFADDFYVSYDFDQPWNAPENQKLFDELGDWFNTYKWKPGLSGNDPESHQTTFKMIVGSQTAYEPSGLGSATLQIEEGMDPFLLIEHTGHPIDWHQPEDLSINDAVEFLSSSDHKTITEHLYEHSFGTYYYGTHVCTMNGNIVDVQSGNEPADLKTFLTQR